MKDDTVDSSPVRLEPESGSGGTTSRSELVYQRLRQDILWLRIPPRSPLKEETLSLTYGASRSPVRQALRQLMDEGLIERKGRLCRVVEMSERDVHDLYEVREALEKTAVKLCAERADPDALAHLARLVEEQSRAVEQGDQKRLTALDSDFHLAIARASNNSFLTRQLSLVHDRVLVTRGREEVAPHWPRRVVVEHRRILSALQRRDVAVAEAEMRYHIQSIVRLHRGLEQEPYAAAG